MSARVASGEGSASFSIPHPLLPPTPVLPSQLENHREEKTHSHAAFLRAGDQAAFYTPLSLILGARWLAQGLRVRVRDDCCYPELQKPRGARAYGNETQDAVSQALDFIEKEQETITVI